MENRRQQKILVIVALVLAISAMTIGFAAFSTMLSISSSAEVTPSSSDFKIKVYGAADGQQLDDAQAGKIGLNDIILSDTKSVGYANESKATLTEAIINNNASSNITISGINVNIKDNPVYTKYGFIIKNEGKYDAYLDISSATVFNEEGERMLIWEFNGTCTPDAEATASLVAATCSDMEMHAMILNETLNNPKTITEDYYIIPKGGFAVLGLAINYEKTDTLADGPFDVSFPDVTLNFSTAKFPITS